MSSHSVLFVCMGNICRSPTAHGVFRKLVEEAGSDVGIFIDSAGTHSYHVGEAPDGRAQSAAMSRGIDISDLRARKVSADDFHRFDYILAMDRENLALLEGIRPPGARADLRLMLSFADAISEAEVPDPYYGGPEGFETVLDMLKDAGQGLLQSITDDSSK